MRIQVNFGSLFVLSLDGIAFYLFTSLAISYSKSCLSHITSERLMKNAVSLFGAGTHEARRREGFKRWFGRVVKAECFKLCRVVSLGFESRHRKTYHKPTANSAVHPPKVGK